MDDALPDRWFSVDLPVLVAIVEASLMGEVGLGLHGAAVGRADELGCRREIPQCVHRLRAARYITTEGKPPFIRVSGVTERALRLTGVYPSAESELARLRAVIDDQIEHAPEAERGKLIALRDALRDMGERVAVKVFSDWLERHGA